MSPEAGFVFWGKRERGEGGEKRVKRILTVLVVALVMAAMVVAMAMPAFAVITQSTNNGHPNTNPAGNCPTGQNKDATPGALNKCS
jgi:multisubunit Na+/H+ antiporter MnhC subunit